MTIRQITPGEAKSRLDSADGSTYLDVRSEAEFREGHPPGAINIPLMHLDAATRQMLPNAEFLEVVRAVVPADRKLIVGCMSGGRSQKACEILESCGYTDLSNMRGGFGGLRDPMGRVIEPGWTQNGFEATTQTAEGADYAALRAKARSEGKDG